MSTAPMGTSYVRPKLWNPYLNRNKTTSPEEFFGRKEILEDILDYLSYPEPQSVALVGERRSGKSSVLSMLYFLLCHRRYGKPGIPEKRFGDLMPEIPDHLVPLFVDPEELVVTDPFHFTWLLIAELLRQEPDLEQFLEKDTLRERISDAPPRRPMVVLNHLLEKAWRHGYRFVVFLDEFELLANNPKLQEVNYLQYLRGISDNYALAYVTASRSPLSRITTTEGHRHSPFDNNFIKTIYLGLLDPRDPTELIHGNLQRVEKATGQDLTFRPADEEAAISLGGRHPYFLKIACAHLFDHTFLHKNDGWKKDAIAEASDEYERLWDTLTPKEKDWVRQIHQAGTYEASKPYANDVVKRLCQFGLIEEVPGDAPSKVTLRLFSESFTSFIRNRVARLQSEYKEIEHHVESGYLNWTPADLEKMTRRLETMRSRWEHRGEDAHSVSPTYNKVRLLENVLRHALQLVREVTRYEGGHEHTPASEKGTSEANEALDHLLDLFDRNDCFGGEKQPSAKVGETLLAQLLGFLQENRRDAVFGNGYDRALTVQIEYLGRHFPEDNKQPERARYAFDRLMEVYDYQRASEILQDKRRWPWAKITQYFLRVPGRTIGTLILLPFLAAWLIQTWPEAKVPENWPWLPLIPIVAVHVPLMAYAFHLAFCCRQERFPGARSLRQKALLPRESLHIVFLVLVVAVGSVSLKKPLVSTPFLTLLFAILAVAASVPLLAWSITERVPIWKYALKRAAYFCGYELLVGIWAALIIACFWHALVEPGVKEYAPFQGLHLEPIIPFEAIDVQFHLPLILFWAAAALFVYCSSHLMKPVPRPPATRAEPAQTDSKKGADAKQDG